MPSLHVTPLSRLDETAAAVRASHLVTLINVGTVVARPPGIAPAQRPARAQGPGQESRAQEDRGEETGSEKTRREKGRAQDRETEPLT